MERTPRQLPRVSGKSPGEMKCLDPTAGSGGSETGLLSNFRGTHTLPTFPRPRENESSSPRLKRHRWKSVSILWSASSGSADEKTGSGGGQLGWTAARASERAAARLRRRNLTAGANYLELGEHRSYGWARLSLRA